MGARSPSPGFGAQAGEATEHSYTEIVDALRQYGSQPVDIEALWRRIAFRASSPTSMTIAYFRISPDRAKAILAEVDGAVATWREEGLALRMTAHDLESFSEAFEHGERESVRRVLK
jgi:hypothetical protein